MRLGRSLPGSSIDKIADEPEVSASSIPADTRDAIFKTVRERLDLDKATRTSREQLAQQLESAISEIANESGHQISEVEQRQLARQLADEMRGIGPLQTLLEDQSITDIMVNGPDSIYVERAGRLVQTRTSFRDEKHLQSVAKRIASRIGRRLDEQSPMVDARLDDGSRVNIVLPPISLRGTLISIRRFPAHAITLDMMTSNQNMSPQMRTFLQAAARGRLNIVISGGTGSGKTTLLNAISQYIDPTERIVTIEDAAELRLQQDHVLPLETRPPSLEGTNEINQRDLVRNALRMRPDRIILGEVRGAEAFDMLQAMNTGHDGSMATLHANAPREALTRIENMLMQAGFELPSRAMRQQIADAVDIVCQVERMNDGMRRITQIDEVTGIEGETISTQTLFKFTYSESMGKVKGGFEVVGTSPRCIEKLKRHGLEAATRAIFSGSGG
ncbi:pilus assembly protein CpaF [Rhodovibrio sodomensis]|uniref:Pilus assembly protein CpaF n=2 Tax=Rhodovibrio sodomensis TaxID=1088 RepID=A0ABS1DFL1_9PROT|nr:pilus assembly protein CpaF [Rhodovibrio sodomensis]